MPCVNVKTQDELDSALKRGDCAHCVGDGWFVARESSHVEARESSHVEASRFVAIHKHSPKAEVTGGVIIEIPPITTVDAWCEFYAAEVTDGVVLIYKALNANYTSGHGGVYTPGSIPVAPDWDGGKDECGKGLHGCATPIDALWFQQDAVTFVACPVRLEDIVVHHPASYPTKIKFRAACRPCFETDRYGKPLLPTTVAAATQVPA